MASVSILTILFIATSLNSKLRQKGRNLHERIGRLVERLYRLNGDTLHVIFVFLLYLPVLPYEEHQKSYLNTKLIYEGYDIHSNTVRPN